MTRASLARIALGRSSCRGLALAASGLAASCNALLDIDVAELACGPEACGADAATAAGPTSSEGSPSAAADLDAGGSPAPAPPLAAAEAPAPPRPAAGAGDDVEAPAAAEASAAAPPLAADAGVPPVPVPAPAAPTGPALGPEGRAVPLPNDLPDAPVSGEIVYSTEAAWEVDGVFRPTFEVHTPTGSYWIVAELGTMVSMQDAYASRPQWIDFSSGFRPLRNVPALAAPPAGVTTRLDIDSQTPTHLRLDVTSADGAWAWVWDFYLTHVTFTLDRAPGPVGLGYRGVPAGSLGVEDQLVLSDGTAQSARSSFQGDAAGPVEWVYFADTSAARSLFLIQHTDDALPEAYQVRDNDSASWLFGAGQISALPVRFSLGLVDSVAHEVVSARVAYVAGAIR